MTKKKWIILIIFIILLTFSGCVKIVEDNNYNTEDYPVENSIVDNEYIAEENGITYRTNVIVIVFELNATEKEINQIVNDIPGEIASKDLADINIYEVNVEKRSLGELEKLSEELTNNPLIESAYPEYLDKIGLDN